MLYNFYGTHKRDQNAHLYYYYYWLLLLSSPLYSHGLVCRVAVSGCLLVLLNRLSVLLLIHFSSEDFIIIENTYNPPSPLSHSNWDVLDVPVPSWNMAWSMMQQKLVYPDHLSSAHTTVVHSTPDLRHVLFKAVIIYWLCTMCQKFPNAETLIINKMSSLLLKASWENEDHMRRCYNVYFAGSTSLVGKKELYFNWIAPMMLCMSQQKNPRT